MGVKTITVREEAYKLLLEMKMEKESFSDVLVRVLRKKLQENPVLWTFSVF